MRIIRTRGQGVGLTQQVGFGFKKLFLTAKIPVREQQLEYTLRRPLEFG